MADECTVDHRSTQKHFLQVLSRGEGIDITTFDKVGAKPMSKLFEETQTQDAVLKYNLHTKRVERWARSARTCIYELQPPGKFWREIARSYPSGKLIRQEREHSTSETLKPWESGLDGAIRCNLEEMKEIWEKAGYMPKADELIGIPGLIPPDVHESSVYPGILSIIEVHSFELYPDLHKRGLSLGDDIIIIKDSDGAEPTDNNTTKTYLRAEPFARPKRAT